MSQGPLNLEIRFLGQKVCSVADIHTDTNKKVKIEDTLSGFHDFFLQPFIKEWSNDNTINTKTPFVTAKSSQTQHLPHILFLEERFRSAL